MSSLYQSRELVFLKLGGSLITDKAQPGTLRREVLDRLAGEIAQAYRERGALSLLLGHGSGSFGHVPARRYNTRQGVSSPQEWLGFAEVWREAAALNHLVMAALHQHGLPAVSLPPSASLVAADREVAAWDLTPVRAALQARLLPVVYGDVVFDQLRGGTIFSTEDLFFFLAQELQPVSILLAGIEPGVWHDYPACTRLVDRITPGSLRSSITGLGGAAAPDVTGGMASKVNQMVGLVERLAGLKVFIFSGMVPGNILRALLGEPVGTVIQTDAG